MRDLNCLRKYYDQDNRTDFKISVWPQCIWCYKNYTFGAIKNVKNAVIIYIVLVSI